MTGTTAAVYWEERAKRFARRGAGLAAVCSYGMPVFYNRSIHLCQRLSLAPWLDVAPGTTVLDIGCGVGRWSRRLARRGALVTGIDVSPTMVDEARRRADADGIAARCHFQVADVTDFDLTDRFSFVLGITVLQHILEPGRLDAAVGGLARHLAPGGRLVLLEAAPAERVTRCDTDVFHARGMGTYLAAFSKAGLEVRAITGVDPAPFKTWVLPYYRCLPKPLAVAALASATALSLPFDVLAGRKCVARSWHKVFVLSRTGEGG
jgi:SAM-dependent methyltransferase